MLGFVPVIDRAQKVEEGLGSSRPEPVGFGLIALLHKLGDTLLHHRPRLVGPVTANVCKMAIGHEGQIYQQLACCCGRTVLRPSIVSLDTSPPGTLGEEGRKA
jgi:hypothetical protein